MLHEFALEPAVLTDSWRRRSYLAQLGVGHGRLIAEIPKFNRWGRAVLEAARAAGRGDLELKRLEEDLASARQKLCVRNRRYPYDGNLPWLANAEANAAALRGIIARENPHDHPKVVVDDDFDGSVEPWRVDGQVVIPRDGQALVAACQPLFEISYQLRLIDPHLDPCMPRWRRGLAPLLRAYEERRRRGAVSNPEAVRAEVHVSNRRSPDDWREAVALLGGVVPVGLQLTVVRWHDARDGARMHARFLLTERGGIQVDYGFDVRAGGTTHVTLLEERFFDEVWRAFTRATARYGFVDEIVLHGEA